MAQVIVRENESLVNNKNKDANQLLPVRFFLNRMEKEIRNGS